MSDIPSDWRGQLDLRAELARIDRDRAETQKLVEENRKFIAEHDKLLAEERKLHRDRWLALFVITASLLSGVVVAILSHFWK
jgi:hypothetical protein